MNLLCFGQNFSFFGGGEGAKEQSDDDDGEQKGTFGRNHPERQRKKTRRLRTSASNPNPAALFESVFAERRHQVAPAVTAAGSR